MKLLEKIRKSEILTSAYEYIHLVGEEITQTNVAKSFKNALGLNSATSHVFKLKVPGAPDCNKPTECGFIFRGHSLLRYSDEYVRAGVHLHDEVRGENILWYRVATGSMRDGTTVRLPVRWKQWWSDWLCECLSGGWEKEELYVDYMVSDRLAAKY